MPETTLFVPDLRSQDDADAVMFELQDLPCVHQAEVDWAQQTAWVSHSGMIAAEDIVAKLLEAGYASEPRPDPCLS
jgi:copper chaperone CopZ